MAQTLVLKAVPPGGTASFFVDARTGVVTVEHAPFELGEPRFALLPIEARGRKYLPPEAEPVAVAEEALRFYAAFLDEAERRFSASTV